MRKIVVYTVWLLGLLTTTACSNKKKENTNTSTIAKDSVSIGLVDTSFLGDKNFPIEHIYNLMAIWKNHKFYKGDMYEDSTHKIKFIELTKLQKSRLIVPFITGELGQKDASTITNLMRAFFISKQDKIGDFQPIVLYIGGDDYSSLTLVVLNRNNVAVSGFNLFGGLDSGPYSVGDSLTAYPSNRYSVLNQKNEITTYNIVNSEFADSLKKPSIADSIVFKSYIDKTGKIITKQIVKVRYRLPYKPEEK